MKRLELFALDITYDCNFRCRHCFNSSGEHGRKNEELTEEQVLEILEAVRKYSPDTICICGGETMLKKELLVKIGDKLKETDITYNVVSNGFLIDESVALQLKESGYSLVQISLDGFKENHEWMRNKTGAYEKAIMAIKYLKKANLKVAVSCAPNRKNIEEIPQLIEFCNDMGVDYFRMQPMMRLGRAQTIEENLLLQNDKEELLKIIYSEREKMSKIKSQINIEWGDPIEHLMAIALDILPIGSISVSAYGEILVSPYLPIVIGNLKKHSLNEYLDAGILDNYNNGFIRKVASLVKNEKELDINAVNNKFPRIFQNNNIYVDYLDKNYTQICADMEEKFWR